MCCSLTITPLDQEIAVQILRTGLFTPDPEEPGVWRRDILEEGGSVKVSFQSYSNRIRISQQPSIGVYSAHSRRITTGVYFEIAAKYAEQVDGEIVQWQTVEGCNEGQMGPRKIANYPLEPLTYDRVCNGFKELLLGRVSQE